MHLVAADARNVIIWSLTPGQAGDAPEGRQLIAALGPHHGAQVALLMDSAYEDNATRELACSLGLHSRWCRPTPGGASPGPTTKPLYRRRNEVERLFRRLKAWRRVFTRYDKLDAMFAAFITVAMIAEALRSVNTT
ncbi:MAG: transposase [Burkholderiaceae bacterium]